MRKTSKKILQSVLLQHIIFWGFLIFSFFLLVFGLSGFSFSIFKPIKILSILLTVFYIAIAVYINLFFLIPRFLKKKKYLHFALLQMLNIHVIIAINLFSSLLIERCSLDKINIMFEYLFEFLLISLMVSITTFLKLLRDWINYQDDAIKFKETQRQKLESELKLLRGQINPHFLFNTLNNLYALSLDKSEKASDIILKLSDLMRYMLYDCRDDFVLIENELQFIKNYIELEKIRIGEECNIEFNVNGDTKKLMIAPLLFIPFIENAFKYGNIQHNYNSYIKIIFDLKKHNQLHFIIENTKDSETGNEINEYSGIGIDNVKKRLFLLYPDNHHLQITEQLNIFKVDLNIHI